MILHRGRRFSIAALVLSLSGCIGAPNGVNVQLRKENQALSSQVAQLKMQHEQDAALVAGMRARSPQVATLSNAELSKLFITRAIHLGRLTGGVNTDTSRPGDQAVKVYVVPVDESNQTIKAAGAISVDIFDLAAKEPQIGHWDFDVDQTRQLWYGQLLIDYYYAVVCVLPKRPEHPDLTVKVTFTDELTKVAFTAQKVVHINLPTTQPSASQPVK